MKKIRLFRKIITTLSLKLQTFISRVEIKMFARRVLIFYYSKVYKARKWCKIHCKHLAQRGTLLAPPPPRPLVFLGASLQKCIPTPQTDVRYVAHSLVAQSLRCAVCIQTPYW